jgi:hypothetical protein
MTPEEQREQVIQNITGMLRSTPFTFEFKVKKNPKGIKVIYEMTQDEMDAMTENAIAKHGTKKKE